MKEVWYKKVVVVVVADIVEMIAAVVVIAVGFDIVIVAVGNWY